MKIIETRPREIGFVLWGHCQNLLDDPRSYKLGISYVCLRGVLLSSHRKPKMYEYQTVRVHMLI